MPLSGTRLAAWLALLVTTPAGHAEDAVEHRMRVLQEP
jgi:hypothetical protein